MTSLGPTVGPSGPTSASIAIVGEAPGAAEVHWGVPFSERPTPDNPRSGGSGRLLTGMLRSVDLTRASCFLTNVARHRPPKNEIDVWFRKGDDSRRLFDKDCLPPIWQGVRTLYAELERVRPNVIAALGNASLWALTGYWGITKWRGSVLPAHPDVAKRLGYAPKVVPTFHPAAVLRQWEWKNDVVADLRRVAAESRFPELRSPEHRFVIEPSLEQLDAWLRQLWTRLEAGPTPVAADIETIKGHIECIGLATSRSDAICIPFLHQQGKPYFDLAGEAWVMQWLQRILTHPNALVIGQNFNYDAQYIARRWGFVPRLRHDTMVMQNVAFPGAPKRLDYLASIYCQHYVYWKDDLKDYRELPDDDELFWTYSCLDVVYTFEIAEVLLRTLAELGVREAYDFQMRLWGPVLAMTLRGIRIDNRRKEAVRQALRDESAAIAARLDWFVPEDVYPRKAGASPWHSSTKQRAEVFYDVLGIAPVLRDRKTKDGYGKSRSTDDDALATIAKREPLLRPIVAMLIRLSEIKAEQTNFVDAWVDDDNRIRGSIDVAGTETFRFAHRKNAFGGGSNLGNLKRMEEE